MFNVISKLKQLICFHDYLTIEIVKSDKFIESIKTKIKTKYCISEKNKEIIINWITFNVIFKSKYRYKEYYKHKICPKCGKSINQIKYLENLMLEKITMDKIEKYFKNIQKLEM